MKLRGIDFGSVLDASGVEGFFREGYRHHGLLKMMGLNLKGCTFVAKTTPLRKREGKMPMRKDGITPKEFLPRCIMPNFRPGNIALSLRMFREGIMLNAVGLSSPGAEALFETGRWQELPDPFWISFMSTATTPEERLVEVEEFVELFKGYLPWFRAPVGIQWNFSCPNVGLNSDELTKEVMAVLEAGSILGIPQMPKFNILAPIWAVREISCSPCCDAICVSNTAHWDDLPTVGINRVKLFGTDISPLAKFGGGGLSGKPLLPLVAQWVNKAKCARIEKPINAGGGILSPNDVERLRWMGASSIFIGSVANLRWWRTGRIIRRAHKLFK
jgi:dihydroorotate dehydrogenase